MKKEEEHIVCANCEVNPQKFDRLCAIYKYQDWPKKFIQELKYRKKLYYSNLLAGILTNAIKMWYQGRTLPDAIIPVPLHRDKLKNRGFNQTYELIKSIGAKLKIPVLPDLCIKHKNTKPQADLSLIKRMQNIKGTFSLNKIMADKILSNNYKNYKHIVIFDDVVTTMSTVNEISILLRNIGVEIIDVWCICRA